MTGISSPSLIVTDIKIAMIDVRPGRRRIDPTWVKTLAELMVSPADCAPIEVVARGERYDLVFGGHRLAAAQTKEWETIPAIVKAAGDFANEAAIILREITENLARRELSVLDRAIDIARWRDIYEATLYVKKAGRPKKAEPEEITAKFAVNFSQAAQKTLGISERAIYLALKIATISAALRDQIALHAVADNESELLLLASQPADRQAQIVEMITRIALPAASVSDAIAILDRKPERQREAAWQKVAANFSRLKVSEQDRFFDLHEGAIQRWLANRRAS